MKKLISLLTFIALTTLTLVSFAQDSKTKDKTTQTPSGKKVKKDCLMMKKGQMMVRKDGKKTKMDKNMTLSNGIKVGTDGKVTMADGNTKMLKEGEKIYMDGTITAAKPKKKK